VLLVGCGGSQPPIAAPGAMPQRSAITQHAARGKSWMSKGASDTDLLYVSNTGDDTFRTDVFVFSYPAGTLLGTLTGFQNPGALCVDKIGDVFVPDQNADNIVEYAHGGTTPIQTLQGTDRPTACAVDPTTGNLAVTSYNHSVSLYKGATGTPTSYSAPFSALFATYDAGGNLFISGPENRGDLVVGELPSGGKSFESVTLDRPSRFPSGGLQWYGNHLVLGQLGPPQYECCGSLFRFIIKGSNGRHAGRFRIKSDIADFYIYEAHVITTLYDHIRIDTYPKRQGSPQLIRSPGGGSYGVVVSPASSFAHRQV
jgi:hypothetical protein